MIKKVFNVPKMHCTACVMVLEGLEDDLKGVKTIKANFHKHRMEVEFDERQISEAEILTAVKNEGYEALPF